MNFSQDRLHDKCGVAAILHTTEDAVELTKLMLFALQHRGQEAAGIVAHTNNGFITHKGMGLVNQVFQPDTLPKGFSGFSAIGHVRYSTSGDQSTIESALQNIQPLCVTTNIGDIAVAHNGNLTNHNELRQELVAAGCAFQSTSDTEVILHLIARSTKASLEERIIEALGRVKGAYSLIFLTKDKMIGVRDPFGFRPLMLGEINGSKIFCSETVALDIIEARHICDVEPGQLISVDTRQKAQQYFVRRNITPKFCSFEWIYFARPDSIINGVSVSEIRRRMGFHLAKHNKIQGDVVISVPDSGRTAALGFSEASGIIYMDGLVRSHYIGRTFIEPGKITRRQKANMKFNVDSSVVKGKRVFMVDDSIVRGTTTKEVAKKLRKAGALEVHELVSCPPIIGSCHFGVDTPDEAELISNIKGSNAELCAFLGVDSVQFLQLEDLMEACGASNHCYGCLTKNYPETIPLKVAA